jgi:hypothetical protein
MARSGAGQRVLGTSRQHAGPKTGRNGQLVGKGFDRTQHPTGRVKSMDSKPRPSTLKGQRTGRG